MILLQKLTSQNMNEFKKIYYKSRISESYDRDFFKLYEEQNFIVKFLFKRFLRLFTYNSNIIGFMWYETPADTNIRIWALYIDTSYINLLTSSTLNSFNNSVLSYEAIDSTKNFSIMKNLGFKVVRPTIFMNLSLSDYHISNIKQYAQNNYTESVTFKTFEINNDEKLRCKIQNEIFSDWNRTPLSVEDVYSDISQDYYINDLSLFINVNNKTIGYGQIVFSREMFTVVNFGIVQEYRGRGYGRMLLNKLILLSKERDIKKLHIRVDENNIKARELYEWAGFAEKYMILKWDR
ncbi:MAG: GNAT family N-acetyltransferase [Clostridium sp.]